MRKLAAAVICAALALTLTGCGNVPTKEKEQEQTSARIVSNVDTETICVILTDTETGVQYMTVKNGYGLSITPLLNADGTPYVEAE